MPLSLPFPTCKFLLLLFHVVLLCTLLFPIPTHETETTLVAPIFKDKSTNLFTLSVNLKTPLRRTNLFIDLGFFFPWIICDANYNSSSFRQIPTNDHCSSCDDVGMGGLSCSNCSMFNPPDPACNPNIFVCDGNPEDPLGKGLPSIGRGLALIDTLALPTTTNNSSILGPLIPISNFTSYSPQLFKALPKHITGLASFVRSKLSLQTQFSTALSTPNIVSLCFPSSPKLNGPGLAFFGSNGPYYALSSSSSKIDLSKFLTYTPLIVNPVAFGDTKINYRMAQLLLTLVWNLPFSKLSELFVKEATSSPFNLRVTTPLKPFNVCYHAPDLTITTAGPSVPTVDLVLHEKDVVWRIVGANSMVRVKNKNGVNLWCLGFVDGGVKNNLVNEKHNQKTPIVIGGKQLEDNLIQFDIESDRFGFTSSLLSRSLSCTNLALLKK
ncbi:unnamed protein product [Lupinus luteus]|uniref:Peptidase A1 domain-containing protein n=1 Tax=Lupinus luteus TaxID=3873 RepID=A0AAV1X338_LUPLU